MMFESVLHVLVYYKYINIVSHIVSVIPHSTLYKPVRVYTTSWLRAENFIVQYNMTIISENIMVYNVIVDVAVQIQT